MARKVFDNSFYQNREDKRRPIPWEGMPIFDIRRNDIYLVDYRETGELCNLIIFNSTKYKGSAPISSLGSYISLQDAHFRLPGEHSPSFTNMPYITEELIKHFQPFCTFWACQYDQWMIKTSYEWLLIKENGDIHIGWERTLLPIPDDIDIRNHIPDKHLKFKDEDHYNRVVKAEIKAQEPAINVNFCTCSFPRIEQRFAGLNSGKFFSFCTSCRLERK